MLEKEYRILDRHELHSNKEFVAPQGLPLVLYYGMAPQPLKERLVVYRDTFGIGGCPSPDRDEGA